MSTAATPVRPPSLQDRLQHYIGGEWVSSGGGGRLGVQNPSTEAYVAETVEGSAQDADAAVRAAHRAWPDWAARPPQERAGFVRAIGDALQARADEIGAVIATEVGMPLRFAVPAQVGLPVTVFHTMADLADTHPWQEQLDGGGLIVREPAGVVAGITPWNMPLYQAAAKVAAALVAGCPIVLKPSELAPLSTFLLAECAAAAGLPPGVLNVVGGTGAAAGEALVTHPLVAVVSLTGSVASGRRVAELAAADIKRVGLELGGKSANVLLDDVDLDDAVPSATQAACFNSGQACNSLSRLLVPRAMLDEVEQRLVEAARALVVGDPFDPGTDLGPLIDGRQLTGVRAHIDAARADGARLLTGGPQAPPGCDRGFFQVPTIFSDVDPASRLGRQEVFGPVLAVQPYRDEAEAIAIANSTSYGLSGGVWSADRDRALAMAMARRMRSGQVKLNGARTRDYLHTPFGGYGISGLGRELGRFGIDEFVEIKAILG